MCFYFIGFFFSSGASSSVWCVHRLAFSLSVLVLVKSVFGTVYIICALG
jgi:hypothetical protein